MTLDLRLVAFEAINFLVLVAILRRFLFAPVRDVVRRRREELAARETAMAARERMATALDAAARARLLGLEQEAEELRRAARAAAAEEAERVLAAARHEREAVLARAQEEADAARRAALAALRDEVLDLAVEAAGRVVDDLADPGVVAAYARRAAADLAAQGGDPAAPVECRVSAGADAAAVAAAVRAALGPDAPVEVVPDAAVRGGVVLRRGDLEVRASAGAALAQWLDEVAAGEGPLVVA